MNNLDNILYLCIAIFAICAVVLIRMFFYNLKQMRRSRARLKQLEENKCKGPHSWIEMHILSKDVHVCKECCYCPSLENYVKKSFVNAKLEEIKFDEELEKYKEEKIDQISTEHSLSYNETKELYKKLISIKKNFTVEYLDKKLEELKKNDPNL